MALTNEDLLAISGLLDKKIGALDAKWEDRMNTFASRMEVRFGAIEARMDARFGAVEARLDAMEAEWKARLDAMDAKWEAKLDAMDAKWEAKLDAMDMRLKRVEMKLENEVVPRLQNIEDCYRTTFDRYRESAAGYEAMQADVEILKKVVMDHSEKLRQMA